MPGLSESTVSHHLGQSHKAGLVISDRRGMNVLSPGPPDALSTLWTVLDFAVLHLT